MSYNAQMRYAKSSVAHISEWSTQAVKCLDTASKSVDFPDKIKYEVPCLKILADHINTLSKDLEKRLDQCIKMGNS